MEPAQNLLQPPPCTPSPHIPFINVPLTTPSVIPLQNFPSLMIWSTTLIIIFFRKKWLSLIYTSLSPSNHSHYLFYYCYNTIYPSFFPLSILLFWKDAFLALYFQLQESLHPPPPKTKHMLPGGGGGT